MGPYAGMVPAETSANDPPSAIFAAWRAESARHVGALTWMARDVELAEDLAQDALVAVLEQRPTAGVPKNPIGTANDLLGGAGTDRFWKRWNQRQIRRGMAALQQAQLPADRRRQRRQPSDS